MSLRSERRGQEGLVLILQLGGMFTTHSFLFSSVLEWAPAVRAAASPSLLCGEELLNLNFQIAVLWKRKAIDRGS